MHSLYLHLFWGWPKISPIKCHGVVCKRATSTTHQSIGWLYNSVAMSCLFESKFFWGPNTYVIVATTYGFMFKFKCETLCVVSFIGLVIRQVQYHHFKSLDLYGKEEEQMKTFNQFNFPISGYWSKWTWFWKVHRWWQGRCSSLATKEGVVLFQLATWI
jgi:hypothetical protein